MVAVEYSEFMNDWRKERTKSTGARSKQVLCSANSVAETGV